MHQCGYTARLKNASRRVTEQWLLAEMVCAFIFFFQAEDGIRDVAVTGVQPCALPIFPRQPGARHDQPRDPAMNEILRDRLLRKLDALPDDKAYQVLDYVEFLESKYAERPAGAPPFQRVAETLEDTLRAGRVPVNIIKGTMDAVGKAGKLLEKVAAAGKAAVEEAAKKSTDKDKVEETPPAQ